MTFIEKYQNLNPKQKEAVDTIYGPVLVIAWPGSGKTQILALRIANILRETDANPSNILCLTFTDNAAKNMRERLASIIGADAYRVAIHTFHTFGLEILNRFRYKLEEEKELTPIDEIESSRIFETLRKDLPYDHPWKKSSRLSLLQDVIRMLKEAWISPSEFREILDINEQILNHIWSYIEKMGERIAALGQKKEEKIAKVSIFHEMYAEVKNLLASTRPSIWLQETLGPVILRGLEEAVNALEHESDTKPITLWKNTWLERGKSWLALKDREKQKESLALASLYEAYTTIMKEKSLIDFSDMILRATRLVETDDNVRATIAEQYQWVMIDEYQDTNDAQLRLITTIMSTGLESPNIFAVGDDDQSIYKFQWASTRNIRLFHDLYTDTRLIILETNYRSQSEIIEFSRSLITEKSAGLASIFPWESKVYKSARGDGGTVELLSFENEFSELAHVADTIEQLIASWVAKKEIAVITKKNATLETLSKLLLAKGIPVALSKEENIFADEAVALLVMMLEYTSSIVWGYDRDDLLITILSHPMWGIHRLTLWELSREIASARKPEKKIWIEALRNHSDRKIARIAEFFIEMALTSRTTRLEDLIDMMTGAVNLRLSEDYTDGDDRAQSSLTFLDEDIFASPFYGYFFSPDRLENDATLYTRHLANIRKLIESVRSYRREQGRLLLSDFETYMSLIREYDISLRSSTLISTDDAVACITAHKAKWLEYAHVFAIGLTEKNYKRGKNSGNPLPSNLPLAPERDNDEDIERLIYTVATRAKDHLSLSYAKMTLSEKSDTLISTLGGIDHDKWTIIEPQLIDSTLITLLETERRDISSLPYSSEEQSFLQSHIRSSLSLSATALQNFLDVTSGWPTHYIGNNILRFPQAKSSAAIYGTAMHRALEDFFTDYKIHKTYKKDILFSSLEKALSEDGLTEDEEHELMERGRANLEKLYPKLVETPYHELHLEYRFTDIYLGDIRLTGAIDRIEVTQDGKLIITDYKTGWGFDSLTGWSGYEAVKKWKYHLQLTFYALLFSLSPRWSAWKTREYRLFFIEEDTKTWEYYEVVEYIQETEVERMKTLITKVAEKIQNLDFPDISKYPETVEGIRQFEEDILNWQV